MNETENNPYEKYIDMDRPPSRHPKMPMSKRAAQFSPFAALTGYEEAVQETARLTEERHELDEYEKEELDRKLQILASHLPDRCPTSFTYFEPDTRKEGGAYHTVTGIIHRMNSYNQTVLLTDGTVIPIHQIIKIESELFRGLDD